MQPTNTRILPIYCVQNFRTPNASNMPTNGDAVNAIKIDPKNVRGTTPGYSL